MPALPAALAAGTFTDGELVTAATWWSRVGALIAAVRERLNPLTSFWQAMNSAAQVIPTNVFTTVLLDSAMADTDGMGVVTNGYQVPADGRYLVMGRTVIAGSTASIKTVNAITVNGSAGVVDGARHASDESGSSTTAVATGCTVLVLSRGDVVGLFVWSDPGDISVANQSTSAAVNTRNVLMVKRLT